MRHFRPVIVCGSLAAALVCGCGESRTVVDPSTAQTGAPPAETPFGPAGGASSSAPRQMAPAAPSRPGSPDLQQRAPQTNARDAANLFAVVPRTPTDEIVGVQQPADSNGEDTMRGEPVRIVPPAKGDDSTRLIVTQVPAGEATSPNPSLALPAGFRAVTSAGYSPDGFPWRIISEKDESVLALVPAGEAIRGSNSGPPEVQPQHRVSVDNFYMDVTEVTLQQYELFRNSSAPAARRSVEPLNQGDPPNHPVLGINYISAENYAKWAGKLIPTEAEWEKAARSGEGFRYPWGNGRPAFHRERTPGKVGPVGEYRTDQSPYGIFDLAGNAKEWCSDWYDPKAYEAFRNMTEVVENDKGPRRSVGSALRVVKGASPDWSVWYREGVSIADQVPNLGFRCVLRSSEKPAPTTEK